MRNPVHLSFRHMDRSPAIEALVSERADKLHEALDHIISLRVVIEPEKKHHRQGNLCKVRIDLSVPGEEIIVTRAASQDFECRDLIVAVRDAFDAARRRLESHLRRRRRDVKTLEGTPHARVSKLMPDEGYGFLQTPDGRELYFHRNSVLREAFEQLSVGTEVAFFEEEGEKGPQASSVKIAGKHGHV